MKRLLILLSKLWPFVFKSDYKAAVAGETKAWNKAGEMEVFANRINSENQQLIKERKQLLEAIKFQELPMHSNVDEDGIVRQYVADLATKPPTFYMEKVFGRRFTITVGFDLNMLDNDIGIMHVENCLQAYVRQCIAEEVIPKLKKVD